MRMLGNGKLSFVTLDSSLEPAFLLVSTNNVDSGQTQIESLQLTDFGRFSLMVIG